MVKCNIITLLMGYPHWLFILAGLVIRQLRLSAFATLHVVFKDEQLRAECNIAVCKEKKND